MSINITVSEKTATRESRFAGGETPETAGKGYAGFSHPICKNNSLFFERNADFLTLVRKSRCMIILHWGGDEGESVNGCATFCKVPVSPSPVVCDLALQVCFCFTSESGTSYKVPSL